MNTSVKMYSRAVYDFSNMCFASHVKQLYQCITLPCEFGMNSLYATASGPVIKMVNLVTLRTGTLFSICARCYRNWTLPTSLTSL